MSFVVSLTSSAGVEEVLAAIKSHAAYWQESAIPSELRRIGALGVRADIRGSGFELTVEDLGRDPPPTEFSLRGTVTANAAGGSRIEARPARGRYAWIAGAVVALLGLGLLWSGALAMGGGMVLVGGVVVAMQWSKPASTDVAMQHLVDRLHHALQVAAQATSPGVI